MLNLTPILRLYAARRQRQLRREDPVAGQEGELLRLLDAAKATRFGRDHGFGAIRTVADFQARVPLRRYEDFWRDCWEPSFPQIRDCTWPGTMPFFALTSGTTTGATKHIPCSHAMNAANVRAALDVLVHHLAARPDSRVLAGRNFVLGGSTDLRELAPGVLAGDLSGIAAHQTPWWARPRYFPPRALETISDWEVKIDRFAEASIKADIRSISGTPSWMLLFFDRLAERHPDRAQELHRFYPDLELVIHGAVNFAPYRKRFGELLKGSRAETREVYAASEGFIAVADRGDGEGLRLITDNGLFFEFVPLEELDAPNPTRHWLKTVETGVNYAVILTTNAGLWTYVLGDTVRFIERSPPRLLITGRTSYMLSAFGEHLIDEEIETAVATAADAIGASVTDYSVGALMPETAGDLGQHLFIVEFDDRVPDRDALASFAASVDRCLSATNEDYEAHRAGGYGLKGPAIQSVPPGSFAAWMKSRGKLGGQHKVPRIITDPTLFSNLRQFFAGR